MPRLAILALAVLAIPGVATARAETSAEFAKLGQKIWPAFECAIAANWMEDHEAQARLFKLGYESGKAFLEALISGKVDKKDVSSSVAIGVTLRLQGPSVDFILGRIWEGVAEDTSDKRQDSCPSCIRDDDLRKMWATTQFRQMNCKLLE